MTCANIHTFISHCRAKIVRILFCRNGTKKINIVRLRNESDCSFIENYRKSKLTHIHIHVYAHMKASHICLILYQ